MIRRFAVAGVVVAGLLASYLAVTFVQVWLAARRDGARPADAIVVLGAAQYDGSPSPVLRARLDHALELHARGLAPVVVVTGGRRPGDRFTEASVGRDYLLSKGLGAGAVRSEDRGTNTWESLAAAAAVLRGEGLTKVLLVTSPYHSLRVEHVAGEVGLDGRASPSRNVGIGSFLTLGREAVVVAVGRVIGYGRLVDLDHQVDRARN